MTIESILALIRHGLTTAGGVLVTAGLSSSDEITSMAGAAVGLMGFGWSIYRKVADKPRRV